MITTQDSTTIITGTGTTGDTIILGDGINTGGTELIIIGLVLLVIIAHLLDRKLGRKLDLDQEQHQKFYQNQNSQE
tara:strand:- start:2319 stop:2546 length:228 start_codon:yes stop_codon:yes gene_type:complete